MQANGTTEMRTELPYLQVSSLLPDSMQRVGQQEGQSSICFCAKKKFKFILNFKSNEETLRLSDQKQIFFLVYTLNMQCINLIFN
jgi:hypothetical protein